MKYICERYILNLTTKIQIRLFSKFYLLYFYEKNESTTNLKMAQLDEVLRAEMLSHSKKIKLSESRCCTYIYFLDNIFG